MNNMDDMEKLVKMQLEAMNNIVGNLKGYDCSICKNKGLIYITPDNKNIEAKECECVPIRRTIKYAEISGLGNYIHKTLLDFKTPEKWQEDIYNKAAEYIKDSGKAWFLIAGQSGAGKTLICSIIANDFLLNQRKRVKYLTWTDFVGKIKRNLMSEKAFEAEKIINEAKNAEILFIDEYLKTHTEADIKYVIEIINYRYAKQLKTIITSELSADELMRIDEAAAGRIFEMAGKKYLSFIGKDRNKNQRLKIVNT